MPVHAVDVYTVGCVLHLCGHVQQAVLTLGTREALNLSIAVLCDPGDNILVPGPGLPYYTMSAVGVGVETRQYHLKVPGLILHHAVLACGCNLSTFPVSFAAKSCML